MSVLGVAIRPHRLIRAVVCREPRAGLGVTRVGSQIEPSIAYARPGQAMSEARPRWRPGWWRCCARCSPTLGLAMALSGYASIGEVAARRSCGGIGATDPVGNRWEGRQKRRRYGA
jgi:hypothetical protein